MSKCFLPKNSKNFVVMAAVSALVLLPGCLDWFGWGADKLEMTVTSETGKAAKVGDDGSKVLISVSGEPIVTETSLDAEIVRMTSLSPEFKQALEIMGDRIRFITADQLLLRHLISRYVQDKGYDKSAEYQNLLETAVAQAKDAVNQQYFMGDASVSVSDRQVREFYDKEKERLLLSQGGNKTKGVLFDDDDIARAFYEKVKAQKGDIAKAAQSDDVLKDKVRDFGFVHSQTIGIDATLREKIAGLKPSALPMTDLLRIDDNTFWVVHVSEHEDKKYRPYEDVKGQIKQMLEEQSRGAAVEQKIEQLKKKYGVEDNRDVPEDICEGLDIPELPEE